MKTSKHLKKEWKEAREWDMDSIKKGIQDLFGSSLSEANYRRLTKEEVIEVASRVLKEKVGDQPAYKSRLTRLLNSLEKCKTRDDVILKLGEHLS